MNFLSKFFRSTLLFFLCQATVFSQAQHVCVSHFMNEQLKQIQPSVDRNQKKLEQLTQQWRQQKKRLTSTITIPVVVHVLYHTPDENISDEQILSQIRVLNEDFSKTNADASLVPPAFSMIAANTNIRFCLARRTPDGKPTTGITRTYTPHSSFNYRDMRQPMKFTAYGGIDAWNRDKYLNIWVCNLHEVTPGTTLIAGYAQFPGGPPETDGVVVSYRFFGTTGNVHPNYRKGRILTHEVGHWLNLRHIWGDAKCGNDFVEDTPTQEKPTTPGTCPSYPRASCDNASDMFMNYMDYTDDDCMYMFTHGQALRMQACLNVFRSSLSTSDGCTSPSSFCSASPVIYTARGATIEDGSMLEDYRNNTNCSWLLQPITGGTIHIRFNHFSTENIHDTLVIYDGYNSSFPVLGKFSGASIPPEINSTGPVVFIQFKTNASVTSSGWSLTYKSSNADRMDFITCGGLSVYTSPSGTLSDGSGAFDYSANLNCKYLIQPSGTNFIHLNFTQFDTEKDYDLVKIYKGPDEFSGLVGIYSGNTLPPSITISGGSAFIVFTSDAYVQKQGWSLNYTTNSGPATCSGTANYSSPSGIVEDGSGSNYYSDNLNCFFRIEPIGATSIQLHFQEFDLENGFDTLYLYDGPTIFSPLLGSFTGTSLPPDLVSSSGVVLLRFITDEYITGQGWKISYTSNGSGGSTCTGTTIFNAPAATITDGSGSQAYVNNTDCKFLIAPSNATSITLHFNEFSTEYTFDWLKIYDGPGESYPLLASVSGNNIPPDITSSGGSVFLHFHSDNTITAQGWSLSYTSSFLPPPPKECNGWHTYIAPSGKITHGDENSFYKNNSDCKFLINPPGAASISLQFLFFDTEQDFDFVKIYDGPNTDSPLLAVLSGVGTNQPILSTGGSMLIHFTSDHAITAGGWYAVYNSSMLPSGNCSGLTTFTGASGTLSDGSGEADYQNNMNCRFLIQPANASAITLSFTSFETETTNDVVKIYDGPSESFPMLGSFSGNNLPPVITSTSGAMLIVFTTDFSIVKKGWTATYQSVTSSSYQICSGLSVYDGPTGSLSDGSGPQQYLNNLNCRFLISPIGATAIQLHFTSFDIESGNDFLKVYNGNNASSPLIGIFSGNTLPLPVKANSGRMYIEFSTNSSITKQGWSASYSALYHTSVEDADVVRGIVISPNPSDKEFYIQGDISSYDQMQVFNILGQTILSLALSNSSPVKVDSESWPEGLYIISFTNVHSGRKTDIKFLKK